MTVNCESFPKSPWIKFPDIEPNSIGWRMGEAEEYLLSYCDWWKEQSYSVQSAIQSIYPAPLGWDDFYVTL
jgi:hypothetical protein